MQKTLYGYDSRQRETKILHMKPEIDQFSEIDFRTENVTTTFFFFFGGGGGGGVGGEGGVRLVTF